MSKYLMVLLTILSTAWASAEPLKDGYKKVIQFTKGSQISSQVFVKEIENFRYVFQECEGSSFSKCNEINKTPVSLAEIDRGLKSVQELKLIDLPIIGVIGKFNSALPQSRVFASEVGLKFLEVIKSQRQEVPLKYSLSGGYPNMIVEQILVYGTIEE